MRIEYIIEEIERSKFKANGLMTLLLVFKQDFNQALVVIMFTKGVGLGRRTTRASTLQFLRG